MLVACAIAAVAALPDSGRAADAARRAPAPPRQGALRPIDGLAGCRRCETPPGPAPDRAAPLRCAPPSPQSVERALVRRHRLGAIAGLPVQRAHLARDAGLLDAARAARYAATDVLVVLHRSGAIAHAAPEIGKASPATASCSTRRRSPIPPAPRARAGSAAPRPRWHTPRVRHRPRRSARGRSVRGRPGGPAQYRWCAILRRVRRATRRRAAPSRRRCAGGAAVGAAGNRVGKRWRVSWWANRQVMSRRPEGPASTRARSASSSAASTGRRRSRPRLRAGPARTAARSPPRRCNTRRVSADMRCSRRSSTTRTVSGSATSSKSRSRVHCSAIVEEAAFVVQLPEQLRDEERVSAGLRGKTPDEPRGRIGLRRAWRASPARRLSPTDAARSRGPGAGRRADRARPSRPPGESSPAGRARDRSRVRSSARQRPAGASTSRQAAMRTTGSVASSGARNCVSCSVDSSAHCMSSMKIGERRRPGCSARRSRGCS